MGWEDDFPVLMVDTELTSASAGGRATRELVDRLQELGLQVLTATTCEDGLALFRSDPGIGCVLLDLETAASGGIDPPAVVSAIRERNEDVPLFLLADRTALADIPLATIQQVTSYVWKLEDTAHFIAGRVLQALEEYVERLLPPFFAELERFVEEYKYSWHTPGHSGGTAFLKSAVGRAFHRFAGESFLRGDLSISVPELGELLDHTGVVGKSERLAARVFGADRTYFVTNGTSSANKMVFHGRVTEGDIVLVDRNCHKSIQHALTMTGAIPVYLIPSRNDHGIIGPIHPQELTPEAVRRKIEACPLVPADHPRRARMAVITNSTYDGLCIDVRRVVELLGESVDSIHFDEAWYGYARFHPVYRGRFAMEEGVGGGDGPTLFATQSTHKLLAALSQASMVHVRSGRDPVEHDRFNEAFMMHTSTSPQYGIIASLDVAARMMGRRSGPVLVQETIQEALAFRQQMCRLRDAHQAAGDWWFEVYQPDSVGQPQQADLDNQARHWTLEPSDDWHGFDDLDPGYCLLDPIKVTILTPGEERSGEMQEEGIPAAVVERFLETRGIVAEKTASYSFLMLFSMGITRGKWGTLITELAEFKRLYDADASLEDVLPALLEEAPGRYDGETLRGLCSRMHGFLRERQINRVAESVFAALPEPVMRPSEAYRHLVRGEVERVPVAEMENRVAAQMLVPYPPGIPVLMPGERVTTRSRDLLDFLALLQDFDSRFPGFEHSVHGVEAVTLPDGRRQYQAYCVKEA